VGVTANCSVMRHIKIEEPLPVLLAPAALTPATMSAVLRCCLFELHQLLGLLLAGRLSPAVVPTLYTSLSRF
jgi:hypothetical protein